MDTPEESPTDYCDGRVLDDQYHERFAVEVAGGVSHLDAYRRARRLSSKSPVPKKRVLAFLNAPGVRYRIGEIQKNIVRKVEDSVAYSTAYIQDKTKELIEQGSKLVPKRDRSGEPIKGVDGEPELVMADSGAFARGVDIGSRHLGLYRAPTADTSEEENKTLSELATQLKALFGEVPLTGAGQAPARGSDPSPSGDEEAEGGSVCALSEAG